MCGVPAGTNNMSSATRAVLVCGLSRLHRPCRTVSSGDLLAGIETDKATMEFDAVSVEAADMSGQGRETRGLDGIRAKHEWWNSTTEVTGGTISDPMPHGDDRFAVIFEMEGREKESGKTFDMKEVGVYHVRDGRVVREEFFYGTG